MFGVELEQNNSRAAKEVNLEGAASTARELAEVRDGHAREMAEVRDRHEREMAEVQDRHSRKMAEVSSRHAQAILKASRYASIREIARWTGDPTSRVYQVIRHRGEPGET